MLLYYLSSYLFTFNLNSSTKAGRVCNSFSAAHVQSEYFYVKHVTSNNTIINIFSVLHKRLRNWSLKRRNHHRNDFKIMLKIMQKLFNIISIQKYFKVNEIGFLIKLSVQNYSDSRNALISALPRRFTQATRAKCACASVMRYPAIVY